MAALHPPHPYVIIHEWSADCRPSLVSMLDLLRSQPPPAVETTSESSEAARSARTERGPGPPRSASEPSHPLSQAAAVSMDSDCVIALLAIAAKLRCAVTQAGASGVAWPDASSVVPLFVATCLSHYVTDACFHDDAWIALRKLPMALADRAHLAEQYARVPLLATVSISHLPFEYEFVAPIADDSDSTAAESSRPSGPPSDCSKLFKSKWKYKIPADRYEWMEFPVAPRSAHMQRVVFAADSPSASLCVLVVADRGSIYDAMSSALYHRRSWGVCAPLVGVSFARDSTVVQLHIGWLEDSSDDLPRVHVLGQAEDSAEASSFRLDDPGDAKAFARGLIALTKSMRHDIRTAQVINENAIPQWRADQQATSVRSTEPKWTHEALCEWNQNIPLGSDPYATPFAVADEEAHSSRSLSFDQFSAFRERNGYRPCATALWLLDRSVVFHSLSPIDVYHDHPTYQLLEESFKDQLPFFLLYRTATRFAWPRPWKSLDRVPNVPRALQGSRRSLFRAFETSREHVSQYAASSQLCDEAIISLERELAAILRVSNLARSLNAASSAQSFRFLYDILFSIVPPWHAMHFVPRPAMHLSRSNLVDTISNSPDRLAEVLQIQFRHHRVQAAEARLFEGVDKVRLLAIERAADRCANDTRDWRKSPYDALQRAVEAPTRGTCDLALVARFHPHCHPEGDMHLPRIIVGHSENMTSRAYPTPYWPSAKFPMGLDERQRVLTLDIMATAHQDYPTVASSETVATAPDSDDFTQPSSPMDTHTAAPRVDVASDSGPGPAIDFPVLLVVHSVQRIRFDIGDSNRLRMCLTSAVQFLASMHIFDFPLFGLFTEGTLCAVVMVWATQRGGEPQVHLMDQNCSSYDISVPAGAFNLATFLLWLRHEHVPRLLARLDEAQRMGVFSRFGSEGSSCAWSAQAQVDQLMREQQG